MKYQETQPGVFIYISLALTLLVLGGAYVMNGASDELHDSFWIVVALICLAVLALFYTLRTEISDDKITVKFGIGLISKNIPLSNIESVEVVRNKWYYGLGIRFYGRGWLWNIHGLDAVELKMKNKKMKLRIGSARPKELARVIQENIS